MAEITSEVKIDAWLPISIVTLLGLAGIFFYLDTTQNPPFFLGLGAFCIMILVALGYILLGLLRQKWNSTYHHPYVGP